MGHILTIDVGTSSCKAALMDPEGEMISSAERRVHSCYSGKNEVEQDPIELWESALFVMLEAIEKAEVRPTQLVGIGITNQRETVVVWDKKTGDPIWNAIVWQDSRTQTACDRWIEQGVEDRVQEKTGLPLTPYFSALKIDWILKNVDQAKRRAENGELLTGTIDSWLIWKLTEGKVHATDPSNASRTQLYNIYTSKFDEDLLKLFEIPHSMMPQVLCSDALFGYSAPAIFGVQVPILAVLGDQQAALFGHRCYQKGDIECTFGTGAFMLMNTGEIAIVAPKKLLTTIAWQLEGNQTTYALEGSSFASGNFVTWLRDSLGLIKHAQDIESLGGSVPDSHGVYCVPALAGLGTPHMDMRARGLFVGLSHSVNLGHLCRSVEEGIAHSVTDVIEVMRQASHLEIKSLKVGGGACGDNLLLQIQSDLLCQDIARGVYKEVSGYGAGLLAGHKAELWDCFGKEKALWKLDHKFSPQMQREDVKMMRYGWSKAVELSKLWALEDAKKQTSQ